MERIIVLTDYLFDSKYRKLVYYNAETVYCLLKCLKKLFKFSNVYYAYIFPIDYADAYITELAERREWYHFLFIRVLSENNLSDKVDELIIVTASVVKYERKGKTFTSYRYDIEVYEILPYKEAVKLSEISLGNVAFVCHVEITEFSNRIEVKAYSSKYLEKHWIKKFKSLNELKQFNTIKDLYYYVQEKGKFVERGD